MWRKRLKAAYGNFTLEYIFTWGWHLRRKTLEKVILTGGHFLFQVSSSQMVRGNGHEVRPTDDFLVPSQSQCVCVRVKDSYTNEWWRCLRSSVTGQHERLRKRHSRSTGESSQALACYWGLVLRDVLYRRLHHRFAGAVKIDIINDILVKLNLASSA